MEPSSVNKFTGNKQTDLIVLAQLDDVSLGRMCQTNQYFKELCRNEDFWRNRTLARFGKAIPRDTMNYTRVGKELTWREYYIRLVDFVEKSFVNSIATEELDLIDLNYHIFDKNNDIFDEIIEHFDKYRWKNMLKQDLINPNSILVMLLAYSPEDDEPFLLRIGQVIEIVKYILSLQDRRINFKYDDYEIYELLFDPDIGWDNDELIDLFFNDPRHDMVDLLIAYIIGRFRYVSGNIDKFGQKVDLTPTRDIQLALQTVKLLHNKIDIPYAEGEFARTAILQLRLIDKGVAIW